MGKFDGFAEKWNGIQKKVVEEREVTQALTGYAKFKHVMGIIIKWLYRLRKVALAIPVVYYALKIASYNSEHLPQLVGINLQSSGAFADFISRNTAVMGPLAVTAGCLVLMFFSRKALYPWAVSVFSLLLPLLLLFSNVYPT